MEIERKWLLSEIPSGFPVCKHYHIEQFYISTKPEMRLRFSENHPVPYKLTYKGEGTIAREEVETEISKEFYDKLKNIIGLEPISKNYYAFKCGRYLLEVSRVDDGEFIYCEIEFPTIEEANNFILPIEGAIEVTNDPQYKMKNYWQNTRLV